MKQEFSLESCKQKIEWLEGVNGELLEVCRALLDMVTDNRTHGPEIDKACQAIAKAEGAEGRDKG
jgi:hypothetical protein